MKSIKIYSNPVDLMKELAPDAEESLTDEQRTWLSDTDPFNPICYVVIDGVKVCTIDGVNGGEVYIEESLTGFVTTTLEILSDFAEEIKEYAESLAAM